MRILFHDPYPPADAVTYALGASACASHETRIAMGMRVIENLEAFYAGHEPRDRVV